MWVNFFNFRVFLRSRKFIISRYGCPPFKFTFPASRSKHQVASFYGGKYLISRFGCQKINFVRYGGK